MITKQFGITITLLALAATASLSVLAGQVVLRKVEPKNRQQSVAAATALESEVLGGAPNSNGRNYYLKITNSTSSTIPAGTRIHFSINAALKDSLILEHALNPGQAVRRGPYSLTPGIIQKPGTSSSDLARRAATTWDPVSNRRSLDRQGRHFEHPGEEKQITQKGESE